jgi:tetratricopeptide (TPR) repeat protein
MSPGDSARATEAAVADEERNLTEEECQELQDQVQLALHLGRGEEALELARRLAAAQPGSTTAHELLADALVKAGELEEAEAEYRHAAEVEPANADAQRKLGEVVLRRRSLDFERQLLQMGMDDRSARGAGRVEPDGAALRSGLFPGLGQLYVGDYEKGAALAVVGLGLLGLAVNGAFDLVSPDKGWGAYYLTFGGIGYVAVYVYSIWDAVRSAREQQRQRQLFHDAGDR